MVETARREKRIASLDGRRFEGRVRADLLTGSICPVALFLAFS
jgi:hypothetical protein